MPLRKVPVVTLLTGALLMVGVGSAAAQTPYALHAESVAGSVIAVGRNSVTVGSATGLQPLGASPSGIYNLSPHFKLVIPGEGVLGTLRQLHVGEFVRLVIGPRGLVDVIIVQPHQGGGSSDAVPTNVTAAETATGISLTWTAVTGAASYQVLVSSGGGYSAVDSASGGTPTAAGTTVTGLVPGTTYTFEVLAIVSGTNSSPSSASDAVEYGARSGTASLTDVAYSYGVWCGTLAVTYDKTLDAATLDTTLSDYTVISNGKTSHPSSVSVSGGELVFGEDVCIGGSAQDTVEINTAKSAVNDPAGAPTTPINAQSTLGNGSGVLAWEAPTGISLTWNPVAGASGYEVLESSGSGYSPVAAANGGSPSVASATITGLAPGAAYSFEVEAVVSGTASAPSQPSDTVEWGARASGAVMTSFAQSGGQDTLTFTVAYDKDLTPASVDSTLTNYTVIDTTTGAALSLSGVSVRGNELVLNAAVPAGSISGTDLVEIGTAASAVNDADAAPTTPIRAAGSL